MTAPRTVEVAVPRPVWGTFTYSVPPDLDGGTLAGCRVAVEFGGARVVGMVWSEGGAPRTEGTLKPLLERLDPHPLPPSPVLKLLHWMADYYFAPPGLCATCGFPPGMQGTAVRVLDVSEGAGLMELCRKPGIHSYDSLKASAPPDFPFEATLFADAARGLVLLLHRPGSLPPQKFETVVETRVKPEELVRAAQAIRDRAPKQADILVRIASTVEPVSRSWLLMECGASRESLNRLVLQGLLQERKREVSRDPLLGLPTEAYPAPALTPDQRTAVDAVASGKGTFLLHGITGSGKTEVYLHVIDRVLTEGRQALVLVPEISLTPQLVNRFNSRFHGKVAVLHSGLSRGERLDAWNMVRRGLRPIVIGARSALFAPLPNPGVLVVDEEHDGSYKQGELPFYNARDMAVLLGSMLSIPVILGSASPSMESFQNAATGRYKLLTLPDRVGGAALPGIRLIDTRDMENRLVTDALLSAIGKHTSRGGQVILLVNRRGHSPIQMCFHCGNTEKCPHCGVAMTYHKRGELLKCHHCAHWKAAGGPCPVCGAERFVRTGPGIQKVEEVLAKQLPGTRVLRMDTDTTRGKSSHRRILDRFRQGGADILLGTQMVAKGHDFPNVTLVGVVNAEMGLSLPDFRSAERVFSLLLQAAGRAGRGNSPGEVLIQTGCPDDPAISAACVHDYQGFARGELSVRRALALPPFTRMLRLLFLGSDSGRVEATAARVGEALAAQAGIQLRGPCPAALSRIGDHFRWSILITAAGHRTVAAAVKNADKAFSNDKHGGVRMTVDVDPQDML